MISKVAVEIRSLIMRVWSRMHFLARSAKLVSGRSWNDFGQNTLGRSWCPNTSKLSSYCSVINRIISCFSTEYLVLYKIDLTGACSWNIISIGVDPVNTSSTFRFGALDLMSIQALPGTGRQWHVYSSWYRTTVWIFVKPRRFTTSSLMWFGDMMSFCSWKNNPTWRKGCEDFTQSIRRSTCKVSPLSLRVSSRRSKASCASSNKWVSSNSCKFLSRCRRSCSVFSILPPVPITYSPRLPPTCCWQPNRNRKHLHGKIVYNALSLYHTHMLE